MTNKGQDERENKELKDKTEIKNLFKSYSQNKDKDTRDKLIEKTYIYSGDFIKKKICK